MFSIVLPRRSALTFVTSCFASRENEALPNQSLYLKERRNFLSFKSFPSLRKDAKMNVAALLPLKANQFTIRMIKVPDFIDL